MVCKIPSSIVNTRQLGVRLPVGHQLDISVTDEISVAFRNHQAVENNQQTWHNILL